jgi:chromosome segregation ATPase
MNTRWSRFCINPSHDNATGCAHDVPDLLAEVDRLRAEVERRERQIGLHLKLANEEVKRADALAAKLDRLRAALDDAEQNHEKWVKFVRSELDNLRDSRDRVHSEISTRCSGLSAWPCPTAYALGLVDTDG